MNLFRVAYTVKRENSDEIYRCFGFRHLSDATQYYVHPNNQSSSGQTRLCQPIGEAIVLFGGMLLSAMYWTAKGDYYISDDNTTVYLSLAVPKPFHNDGVIDSGICHYRALLRGNALTVGAYDSTDKWLGGDIKQLQPLYKLLPAFCVLLAREIETSETFRKAFFAFLKDPVADEFVNLHEDFYQAHKTDEYAFSYADIAHVDTQSMRSFSSNCQVIKNDIGKETYKPPPYIRQFLKTDFTEEQKRFIPRLPAEFVMPTNLNGICNAVANGDMLSVLFHGPAGTGKTMSCKLVAQTIALPIMETINCTENLDEFVLGKYIPQDDRIVFMESQVTKAIRDGGCVVFEEINFARPQYLAFLNSLLDDNGFVRLDNGEVVRRHPHFRFFATMNIGYFGTKELNQALYNRFGGIVEIAALPDEAISRMLTARVPSCEPEISKLLGVYRKLKKKIESEELDVVISPRNLENWARLAKYEGYIRAAEKTIVPIAKCDRALEEAIRGVIHLYQWP